MSVLLVLMSCGDSEALPESTTDESTTEAQAEIETETETETETQAETETGELRTELQFDLRAVTAEFNMEQTVPILRIEYDYTRPPALREADAEPTVQAAHVELRGASEVVRYVLGFSPGRNTVHLHLHDLGEPVHEVLLTNSEAEFRLLSYELIALPRELSRSDIAEPIPADLGQIIDYPQGRWRREEFELFSWSAYPEIYVLDFGRLTLQTAFLKRLSFFVEKDGSRGTLLTNAELEDRHGWNAHNYSASGLANFFTAAAAQDFPLNPEEELLRTLMLARGVILGGSEGVYTPGPGGVISFSRELPHLRRVFLTHEAMHGLFYMEDEFRDYIFEYWEGLSNEERRFWRSFFQYRSFDPEYEYLMVNEFQAYLLQQEPERATNYFTNTWVWRLREAQPEDAAWVNEVLRNQPEMFSQPAHDLNRVLWRHSGYRGGDVLRLRRVVD
ncbi:MAG: hypothetical protein LC641_06405 [Spirochaeta sp.]|nr:hypothetical protein [Spirochaeta sp.]